MCARTPLQVCRNASREAEGRAARVRRRPSCLPACNGIAPQNRGFRTALTLTKPRLVAFVIAVVALFSTLLIGVSLNLNGILVAGAAMTVQHITELSVLSVLWKRNQSTISGVL